MSSHLTRRSFLKTSGLLVAAGFASQLPANLPSRINAQGQKVLTIGINAEPAALDPVHQGRSIAHYRHYYMIFDTLVRTDTDINLLPGLATEWTTEDGITWVFTLRDDVIFHDGSPFTADDVVFTIESVLSGALPGNSRSQVEPFVASVEATGDYEVTLTATGIDPNIPLRVSQTNFMIVSRAAVEAAGGFEAMQWSPIATGPFKVAEYIAGDRLVLDANTDYWMGAPDVDQIIIRYIPEDATRVAALQSGDVDFITTIRPDLVESIEAVEGLTVDAVPVINFMQVNINTTNAPVDNVHVRRALSLAIDRETLVNELWGGRTRAMNEYLLPQEEGYDPSLDLFPYDPEAARAELELAGYSGEPITFLAPVTYYSNMQVISDALFAMWSAVGINIDYQPGDTAAWREWNADGNGHFTIVSAGSPGKPALRSDFESWLAGNFAETLWTPPAEYLELFDQVRVELDEATRIDQLRQMIDIIYENMPTIPLYQSVEFYGRREAVNWTPHSRFRIDPRPDTLSLDDE